MRQKKKINKKSNQGFTLIEVLVSVLVLSIGIFGLIALESAALKNNQDAYLRSQATVLLYDMADKMRSNMSANYGSVSAVSHATSCINYTGAISGSGCDAEDIAERDLYEWENSIDTILPSGVGTISSASTGLSSISISWDDDRDPATSAASISVSLQL